jgi:hypothetical protein
MGDKNLLSGNNFLWLLVVGIIIVAIVILVLSRRDDAEPKEVQDKNDRNLLPYAVGVGAAILIVGIAWYYGLFSSENGKDEAAGVASASPIRIASTRGKTPQQVNEERIAQSESRSPSKSPVRSQSASSRSPPRGSLSARSRSAE